MITVVGYDGSPLGDEAVAALAGAALVVGGARHLKAVEASVQADARTIVLGNVSTALDEIDAFASTERQGGGVAVVASGDPSFFGIVRALRERGHRPRVIPALSSVAQAFARAGLPWDDAVVVSAHGRDLRRAVNVCRAFPKVAVLTAPGAGPAELARELFPQTPRSFVVCEDLGGPNERVVHVRPAEASTRPWREPNVVLVLDSRRSVGERGWIAGARPGPAGWALPETAFEHRNSLITKPEVRALALAKLGPRVGDLVWDIGAGSGSVAIECARFGAAVVAVERDEASCDRIRANVRAYGVKVAVSRGEAPGVLEHLPVPDAVFVGGGGPEVVQECAARALRCVAVALIAVERVRPTIDALREEGMVVDAVHVQASRLAEMPGDVHRFAATNPVYLVWGVREGAVPSEVAVEEVRAVRSEDIAQLPEEGNGE
ncbi:precorrin-6y C5,15-methyltransferase (decarboxylating) subunit CbiE [Actinomadura barringtoniae]|uniref:Precorrin-6y C5,15-methyltransferase (Decarboxylating) subunit CbiE n=1 Tax=Actinomadura barringtoniae TaxID=1427535 RepID=A0A939P5W5_9ACTN|nr:precorrin-6y C5,15-methyltransferase (decarboxylating) subunit CbiE [Actinomadura barringtoniae]MBO2445798.1 precorrin-6y C5,15-methyltransferase (decarboxylating) subunit CbiE [Actinomadura barringtoniae]